ncbi:hypothetical protein A7E78_05105 [Syntrophotalea acetylenivorans]|uniref:TIR domain-containing protein n=1 Tax=Syntrophotalea acetylenivorans TaxID=1842532 RepID=A0A1L3GMV6_9BACT|nr:TIR domain-containing protein [Syntrophotalea acetylenivorans]APG27273.1 hypothetical protein A7E78_05105 [Syntrophotalea acetylenivorans]
MKVFLSWSGQRARALAEVLRDWLPEVLQAVQPWLSPEDIPLGPHWASEIAHRLENADAGIICLTQENVHPRWLRFEAEALSSSLTAPLSIYALDLIPADIGGPLSPFQCAIAKKESTYRLIDSLNTLSGKYMMTEENLKRVFEIQWPVLEDLLRSVSELKTEEKDNKKHKSFEEKLDEALDLLHSLCASNSPTSTQSGRSQTLRPKIFHSQPRVFVSSSIEGLHIAETIQADLEAIAECTIWTQEISSENFENIVNIAADFDYAIIVLTVDDILIKNETERLGPRDNIVFELGLFTGTLGRAHTFMVLCKDDPIHLPSDLVGVTVAMYSRRSADNLKTALDPVCIQIKRAMGVA